MRADGSRGNIPARNHTEGDHETMPAPKPETVELLDDIASRARTALDDPQGVGLAPFARIAIEHAGAWPAFCYAIERCDDIIEALNPSDESRESYARTFYVLAAQVDDLFHRCAALMAAGADEPERVAYWAAAKAAAEAATKLRDGAYVLREGARS